MTAAQATGSMDLTTLTLAEAIGKREAAWLVIRHAARFPIPKGTPGTDVLLTEEGERSALEAGRRFREHRLIRVVSSPLRRCVDTARLFTDGSGSGLEPVIDDRLGDGGLFVRERSLSSDALAEHGAPSVISQMLRSEAGPSGFGSLHEGLGAYLGWISFGLAEDAARHGAGLTVMVTHDSNVAGIAGGVFGRHSVIDAWPGFLDGVLFRQDGDGLMAHYHGLVASLPHAAGSAGFFAATP